ncbi:MAG: hypothetical protein GZ091_09640 [Paludibacter sp.]|nr:hypothetical protein [Paludibacter sp.]
MNYTQRQHELIAQFQLGKDKQIKNSQVSIRYFSFNSQLLSVIDNKAVDVTVDASINENLAFQYPVFLPEKTKRTDKAILLLHGLNERNWSKYLAWAEYLCRETGKPVILFPIAFHMNRSPQSWSNPRDLQNVLDIRRKRNGDDRSLSFANVALSERISENPYRFYSSGRQSVFDLMHLISDVKEGKHDLFAENCNIDIFAYSIGAFLSQVTLMSDPHGLFSDSKLFLFCGGGIFSSMSGESRSIMDKRAFQNLYSYYMYDFCSEAQKFSIRDKIFESFNRMISPEREQLDRELFFNKLGDNFKGISLLNDKVMPFYGVPEAIGTECAHANIQLLDFPFSYSHENPFPIGAKFRAEEVDASFTQVFSQASQFLA